jgi:muramoyltetrapeptide carboxypeptidase LdcA involved in peptidoglycan recycling
MCFQVGRAKGPLVGGNLTMILHLLAASRLPDMNGAVLFWKMSASRRTRSTV